MRLLPRTPRGTILLAVLVGAAGVAALGFGLPPRPRLAWTPPEPAELVGFLPDGRTLLTLNHDPASLDPAGPLRRWDVAAGSETTIRLPGAGPMRYPLLSPDGRWLAWIDVNQDRFRVAEADTGREVLAVPREERSFIDGGAAFSPDGKVLALSLMEGKARRVGLWDTDTGRQVATLEGAMSPLAFAPVGRALAASRVADLPDGVTVVGGVRVWDVTDPAAPVERWKAVSDAGVSWLTFSGDGRRLAAEFFLPNAGGFDARAEWWDAADGRRIGRVDGRWVAQFLDDGATIALFGAEPATKPDRQRWVEFWDADPPAPRAQATGIVINVVWPSRWVAATVSRRNVLNDWIGQVCERVKVPWPFRGPSLTIRLYDADGREVDRLPGNALHGVWSPDGRTLAVPDDGRLLLWDVPPRRPWGWFVGLSAAWVLGIAALTRWRVRHASAKRR